jgi:hypothetical protein
MMAILNLGETLETMIPDWESQMPGSALSRERVSISLLVGKESFRLRANRGGIDVSAGIDENKLSLSQQDFLYLLTGHQHLDDILNQKRRILSPAARQFLGLLFPKRTPFVWPFDRF